LIHNENNTNSVKKGNVLPFFGTHIEIDPKALQDSSFRSLLPSATIDVHFDVAYVYDLSAGGIVELVSRGTLLYATSGSVVTGSIPFESNILTVNIDGSEAAATREAHIANVWNPEFILQGGCTQGQHDLLDKVRALCENRAYSAWKASLPGTGNHAKILEFFKDDTEAIRKKLNEGFLTMGLECTSMNEGVTKMYCNDQGDCPAGVLATTVWAGNELNLKYCPMWFNSYYQIDHPGCHEGDKTKTMTHELAHALFSVGDVKYGYDNFVLLNSTENLNNADTYAFFAKGKLLTAIASMLCNC
jgi:deuterolysin